MSKTLPTVPAHSVQMEKGIREEAVKMEEEVEEGVRIQLKAQCPLPSTPATDKQSRR